MKTTYNGLIHQITYEKEFQEREEFLIKNKLREKEINKSYASIMIGTNYYGENFRKNRSTKIFTLVKDFRNLL